MPSYWSRLKAYPEVWVSLIITLLSFPLLPFIKAVSPSLVAILALVWFMPPGMAVVCLLGDDGNWWERLSSAFVASLGVCGVISQATVFLHTSLTVYVWSFFILTALLVILAAVHSWRTRTRSQPLQVEDRTSPWLIVVLLFLIGALTYFWFNSPSDGDQWDNLAWIQNIRYDPQMLVIEPRFEAGIVSPRFYFSDWLVHQAMMSAVTNIDPVDLFRPQSLILMLLSLAAVYRLARKVAGRRDGAALITVIWILYLLIWNQGTVAGYEVTVRSGLDKVIAGFTIVPIGLSLVIDLFNHWQWRNLVWLLIISVAAALTHPISGALFALSLAGFAVFELLLHRSWQTARRLALVTVCLLLSLTSSIYLVIWGLGHPGSSLVATSLTDTRDPSLYPEISGAFNKERIYVLDSGAYVMHPSLILQPLHIPAFLALPFLFRRRRRSRSACLLFGMLFFITFAVMFPPIADAMGEFITPSLFYRLHWPLSLAAVMTVGWGTAGLLQKLPRISQQTVVGVLALLVTIGLSLPLMLANLTWLSERKAAIDSNYCQLADPLLRSFQTLTPYHAGTSLGAAEIINRADSNVVLGDSDLTDFCLVAYAPYATVVEFHGTNGIRTFIAIDRTAEGWQRLFDVQYYRNAEVVDEQLLSILNRWKVHYLVVDLDSPLEPQLRHLPSLFRQVETAFHRRVYEMLAPLSDSAAADEHTAPIIQANSAFTGQDFSKAINLYQKLLTTGDMDIRYLAAIGLGRAYLQTGRVDDALTAWQTAGQTADEGQAFALQGEAQALRANWDQARQAYQQAVNLQPDNDVFQTRLGDLAQATGLIGQAEQAYQSAAALITGAPNSSNAYVQIGQQWFNSGNAQAALAAFQQANQILETGSTYAQMGQVYQNTQQWTMAEAAYRKMTMLDLWDWDAHTHLGTLYSVRNDNAQAVAEYQTALHLNPLANGVYHSLADEWASQLGTSSAIKQFAQLVGYRLRFGNAVVAMSDLHAKAGQLDQSYTEAQQAISWYRLGTTAYKTAANAELLKGAVDRSITDYRFVTELDVNDADPYLKLAQTALRRGDVPTLEGYTLRAMLAAPYSAGPQLAWADFYNSQDRPDLALAQYQLALNKSSDMASAWIALGEFQLGQSKLDEAANSFQHALTVQPSATAAMRGLGAVQQGSGRSAEAATVLSEAVKLSPGDGANRVDLADLLSSAGKFDLAIEQLKTAMESDPGNSSTYIHLGELYQKLGRTAETENVYNQLIANLPDVADGYLGLGRLQERQGNPSGAEASYRQGLQKVAPDASGDLSVALADLQRRQGLFDLSLAGYRTAIAQQPTLVSGYVALSQLLVQRGEVLTATEAIQSGLRILPGAPDLSDALAAIQIQTGQIDAAQQTYRRVLTNRPAALNSAIAQTDLYVALGQPQAAQAALDFAQHSRPGSTAVLAQSVSLALQAGEPQAALTRALQLTSLAPGEAASWLALGQTRAALGQFSDAETAYRQAAQVEPGSAQPWLALGQYLFERGKTEEAIAALQTAVKSDQSHTDAHLALADIFNHQGRLSDASDEYQIASRLDATQDTAGLALGTLAQSKGKLVEAQQYFDQALLAAPTDPQAYKAYADLDLQQNKNMEARQALLKAVKVAPGACKSFQNLGRFLADHGEWLSAESSYHQAEALPGCVAGVDIDLGNVYFVQAQPENAIAEYKQAIVADPGDAWGYVVLADVYTRLGRQAEATQVYDQAVTRVPASDLLYAAMGQSLILQGKLQDGLDAIHKATDLNPANAFNFDTLGRIDQTLGQFQEAERSYQQAASMDLRLPQPYLSLGDLYAHQGRFEAAQAAYQQAIAIDPSEPRGYNRLAGLLQSHAQTQAAIAVYQQGIAASKAPIDLLLSLGNLYEVLGRLPEAEPLYSQALASAAVATTPYNDPLQFQDETAPASAQVYVALGDWHRFQTDWKAAEQSYRNAIEADPIVPDGYIRLAQLFQLQGRKQAAFDQFQAAIRAAPASAQAYVALGDWQQAQGNWGAAQQAYQQAIAVNHLDARGYINLGQLYQLQGRQPAALEQFQLAIQAAPAAPQGYVTLGYWQRLQGNWAAAEQAYKQAIEVDHIEPSGYIGLGQLNQLQGRQPEALAQFQAAVQAAPSSAAAYLALGDWQRLQTNWQAAEQAYRKAVEVDRIDPGGYIGLGQISQLQGRKQAALDQFQAAVRAAPASTQAYVALGDWQLFQGNWSAAKQAYTDAIQVAPTEPDGYLGLSQSYHLQGQPFEALHQLQMATQVVTTSAQVFLALGDWHQYQGDWSGAIRPYQQAIALAPTDPDGYISLGHVYQSQGRRTAAIDQFQSAIKAAPASAHPYVALGDLYAELGNLSMAQTNYLTATLKEPTYGAAYHAAANGYRLLDQPEQSITLYHRGIEMAPSAVENYLGLGEYLLNQGQLTAARKMFTQATTAIPGSGEVWHASGDAAVVAGLFDAAAIAYRQGIQVAPTFDLNYLSLAQLQLRQMQILTAEQNIQAGLAMSPISSDLHSALGALRLRQGDLAGARTEYFNATRLNPTDVFGYIKYAKFLLTQGELGAARTEYLTATQVDPRSAQAWSGLGDVYQRLGQFSAAASNYLTATTLFPDQYVSAYGELEKVASLLGQTDETALNAYRNAASRFPSASVPWLSIGNIYRARGDLKSATDSYQHAIQLEPGNVEARVALARVYLLQNDWASAKTQYEQAIAIQPGNMLGHLAFGNGWLAQSEYASAALEYQRAISLDLSSAQPYLALGALAQAQNNLSQAASQYAQATVTDPTDLAGWLSLGEAYQSLHQLDSALAAYMQAGQTDRSQAEPWLLAGQLMLTQNASNADKQAAAQADYEQALAIQPGDPQGHLLLADLYTLQEHSSEAFGEISKTLSLAPGYSLAYEARGRWWAAQYKFDQAIPDLEQAAQLDPTNIDVYTQLVDIYNRYNIFVQPPCETSPSGQKACAALNADAPSALPARTPQYAWMSASDPSAAWLHGILATFYQQPLVYGADASARQYEFLVGRFPEFAEFHRQLALLSEALNRPADAIQQWKIYLALVINGLDRQEAELHLSDLHSSIIP